MIAAKQLQKGALKEGKMLFEDNIFNMENYKSQIQKYALCCDDFNDGVYRNLKERALLKNI